MKPIAAADPDQVRETLRSLAVEHRVTLSALSRMLRRPSGYLSRFARGAGPLRLAINEQQLLAQYFRVDPRLFGEREDWE
ncbi:peptidase S24 [Sphingomonas sp. CARO-RG-8B-R24-01]|uniref:peptidase S24 n=1 Tax=Sphingomonas sp. CARO-RG-8B-R24-01 TaxID=2914831 RepID=UPI001F5733D3|nr:peptidase S24 [Sphingomonas sp. CARO-RG-8B-R24-01]